MKEKIISVATAIRQHRYADAAVLFVAGSFIRGEARAFSDIDLVVVYELLPNAYRESFCFDGFAVEAFVHDPQTLHYFFSEVDRPSGIPALPQMVNEGIELPESTALSRSLKALATSVLDMGPPLLTPAEDRARRYQITDLLDDLRDPRSSAELIATGAQLYEVLADYYLRAAGRWSAKGKSIPRVLAQVNPSLYARYCESFEQFFKHGDTSAVLAQGEALLQPYGGLLFAGDRCDAPPHWRKALPE